MYLMNKSYEVEIKSLLGSKENVDKLKKNLQQKFPETKLIGTGKQLNHYFHVPADISLLVKNVLPIISADKKASLDHILKDGKKISLRTRDADGKVILVLKASVGGDSSSNGVKRIEFESVVAKTLTQLDQILLDSGATYQAKWSREREEYATNDMHVCIDRNAGYGYLAEFEKVVSDETMVDKAHTDLLALMKTLGADELPQDRLERMFAHYNAHWADYYGTEKTFNIA